jgi:hypothetical protein
MAADRKWADSTRVRGSVVQKSMWAVGDAVAGGTRWSSRSKRTGALGTRRFGSRLPTSFSVVLNYSRMRLPWTMAATVTIAPSTR